MNAKSARTTVEEPQQTATPPDAPSAYPSPKDLALSHLTTPSQRQLVEALAEQQALSDDHPIWAIVAMLGAVVSSAPVRQDQSGFAVDPRRVHDTLAQKGDIEAARTEIRVLASEIRVLTGEIRVLAGEIPALRSQAEALSAEVKTLQALLDSHLDDIAKVISGAANLNRKIPEFLEGLKAALLPRTGKPQR